MSRQSQAQLFTFLRGIEKKAHQFLHLMSPTIAIVDRNEQDGHGFAAEFGNFASNTCAQKNCSGKLFILLLFFLHLLTLVHAGDGTKPRFLEPYLQSQGKGKEKYRFYCVQCMVMKERVGQKKVSNVGIRSAQYAKLPFSAGINLFKSQYEELGQWQKK